MTESQYIIFTLFAMAYCLRFDWVLREWKYESDKKEKL